MAPWLLDDATLHWSVGGAWHNYSGTGTQNFGAANPFDLGTTASRHMEYPGGWTTLTAAFSWQNVFDNTYQYAGWKLRLERLLRAGLTMSTAFRMSGSSDPSQPK